MTRQIKCVAYTGEKINAEGKKLLDRLSCRAEGNIKMDLKKVGWEGVDYIRLVQDTGALTVL